MALFLLALFTLPHQIEKMLQKGGADETFRWSLQGAKIKLPFTLQGDSLVFEQSPNRITIHRPQFQFDPFAYRSAAIPFFSFTSDKLSLHLSDTSSTSGESRSSGSTTDEKISFPPWLIIPFRAALVIDRTELFFDSDTLLAHDLRIRSLGWQDAGLVIEQIQTKHLAAPLRLGLRLRWNDSDLLTATLRANSYDDSLSVIALLPKKDLRLYNATINGSINSPQELIPLLKESPIAFNSFKLNAKVAGEENLLQPTHSGEIRLSSGEFEPLTPMGWRIHWNGRGERIQSEIKGKGKGTELIDLQLAAAPHFAQATGEVHGLSIVLSDWQLPIDFSIHSLEWQEGSVTALLSTNHGTEVALELDKFSPLHGSLRAKPVSDDPWASIWTEGETRFQSGEIRGEFNSSMIALRANLQGVYAYGFEVDTLFTRLKIDSAGLLFWDSRLIRDDIRYPFHGEISPWDPEYIRFAVKFPESGEAELLGDISNYLTVKATQIPLRYLPYGRDYKILSLLGTADAVWSMDMNQMNSHGKARLSTTLNSTTKPLRMVTHFTQEGDTVAFDSIKVVQGNNTAHGSLLLAPGTKSRMIPGLLKAEIGADSILLSHLLAPWLKGKRLSGRVTGHLSFDNDFGLEGGMTIDSFAVGGEEGMLLVSNQLTLNTDNDKIQIFGRVQNSFDEMWDGELAITAEDLFYEKKKISAAVATDGGAIAWVEANTDMELIEGRFNAKGKWHAPSSDLALDSLSLLGEFRWALEKGIPALKLSFQQNSGLLTYREMTPLPIETKGSIVNSQASIVSQLKNERLEQIKLDFVYDLSQMLTKKVQFGTKQFQLTLSPTEVVTIQHLNGSLTDNRLGFTAPRIHYFNRINRQSVINTTLKKTEGLFTIAPQGSRSSLDLSAHIDTLLYFNYSLPELSAWGLVQEIPNLIAKKEKKPKKQSKDKVGKPINLELQIQEAENSAIAIQTNVMQLPLSINLTVRGTDQTPILSGDIRAPDDGWLTLQKDRYTINTASVSWESQPLNQGRVDVQAYRNLHYCRTTTEHDVEDNCDVALTISGSLDKVGLNSRTDGCSEELPLRHALQSFQQGCISSESEQNLLGTGLSAAEDFLEDASKDVTEMVNRSIGTDLFGAPKFDFARGAQNYLETKEGDLDSASISGELPFYLNKDSTLIFNFGYTKATGSEATYNDLVKAGLHWLFHQSKRSDDPWQGRYSLQLSGQWRRFSYNSEGESEDENRLEWGVGVAHEVGFWGDCLFGRCKEKGTRKRLDEDEDDW